MPSPTGQVIAAYNRTIIAAGLILLALVFSFSGLRQDVWIDLYGFFEWMETTWFGIIGKTYGSVFAVVQAFHLLAMSLLGGAVLVSDARLLGWVFVDLPARQILDRSHKIFVIGLAVAIITGVFMACGVAGKLYYLPVFWYKMLALAVGVLFVFVVKRPLLRRELQEINPWVIKMVAVSSIMVWFLVAATGRWIGFAGS
jgi:hypothetical protein